MYRISIAEDPYEYHLDEIYYSDEGRGCAMTLALSDPMILEVCTPVKEIHVAEDKSVSLSKALAEIEKQFGKGSIMKMGDFAASMKVESIPTGSIALDLALGVGGVPRGRMVEIYGPESSGKTTLSLHIIAEAQKAGGTAAFIDVEHALDPTYAAALGVDLDNLLVSQPDTGEQALDIAEMLVKSNAVDVVVLDSVAALVTKSELEGDMGDMHVGLQARLMSQACRKLTAAISRSGCVMIFINQLREKVGVMFGSPETTSGGRALKFYASVRLDVRKLEQIKIGNDVVGTRTRVKVVKNKVAPPFRQAEFDITYGRGISKSGSILDVALEMNIVSKSGSWFNYGDMRVGQGRENSKTFLEEKPHIMEEISQKILAEVAAKASALKEIANAKAAASAVANGRASMEIPAGGVPDSPPPTTGMFDSE